MVMVMGKTEKGEEMRRKAMKFKDKLKEAIKESEGVEESSIKATANSSMQPSEKAQEPSPVHSEAPFFL